MASVYFDPELGGDGSTVTDDADPSTGLANGGHRARFVPALSQAVAMASTAKGRAAAANQSAQETANLSDTVAQRADQVELDAQQTAADRVQTGEDRVQTGEDRVQTGEDRQAAQASRLAAEGLYGDLAAVSQAKDDAVDAASRGKDSADAASQSEQSSAESADTATRQASLADARASSARSSEQGAADYATTAQQARDAALTSGAVYTDTASGLGQTPSGEHFSVPSPDEDEHLILYLNDGGVAVEKKRYPSSLALEGMKAQIMQLLHQMVATNDLAAQAAREVPDSRMLEQLIHQMGAIQDLAGQAAKAVSGGDVLLRGGSAADPSVAPLGDRDTGLYFPAADAIALAVAGLEALRLDPAGRLGVGTDTPSCKLDVNEDRLRVRHAHTPASATASGNQGDITWDADHVYICTATNTWKRAALSSW